MTLDEMEQEAIAARLNGIAGQVDLAEFLRESEEDNNCQGDAPILAPAGERRLRALLEWEAAITPDVVIALVARVRAAESAVRFLWDGWSDAEGSGQPDTHVFGDDKLDTYLAEIGEPVPTRAPADVQAVIREVVGK